MKVNVTAYYNRDPQTIVVEDPSCKNSLIKDFVTLFGFVPVRVNSLPVPGKFKFICLIDEAEFNLVVALVRDGCAYLSGGNSEYSFSV